MSILRRLWPRRRAAASITMGVHVVMVPKPIPVIDRKPEMDDRGGSDNQCWWGYWQDDRWIWTWESWRSHEHTHWLPANVEVLPTRCCVPEVG